ncbi:MAG: HEAT repeat domain-containing protein, partial [Planctomycetota bacterium]
AAPASALLPLPWRRWLDDAEAVSERERRLVASAVSPDFAGRRYVSYQFDLELAERKEEGGGIPRPRPFRVLDGRRAELVAGVPLALSDRWGNAFFLLVEPLGTAGAGGRERVRVNRRGVYALGAPSFFSLDGRPAQVRAYEVSDASPGVRALPAAPAGVPGLKSIAVFLRAEDDVLSPAGEADPELLWKRFAEDFLLRLEPSAPQARISAALALFSELEIEGRTAFLRRLLEARPSLDLARALHAAGDPEGLRAIRGFLSSPDPAARVQAALALSELADPGGPEALLDLLRGNPDLERRFAYPALNVLDGRLRDLGPEDPLRVRILDFVHGALSSPSLQGRAFSILGREFGDDFGFQKAASSGDAAARKKAVDEAVSRAREAWARRSQGTSR